MEILSDNAENTLASLASSIGRDPESWEGWLCLNFEIREENCSQDNSIVWVKNIVESYLKDTNGRVFFCSDHQIYIIGKDIAAKNLGQIGALIFDMVHEDGAVTAQYKIYDLAKDALEFSNAFFKRYNMLNLNVKEHASLSEESQICTRSGLVNDAPEVTPHRHVDSPRVLLIEDDPITRFMVRKAIKGECELATAPEGNKAFSLYASYQPDVVFLDINLPDLSGYDVLEWIMNNDPGACVVMFSSNSDMDNIASSMSYGAKGFISKPFSKEKLLHYIHSHTG